MQGKRHPCRRICEKISGASAGWAQSRQKFAWTTGVLRQFRTFSAKQRRSPLLFMLKSNKNLEPVSLWVPNLRRRGKGHKVSLSKPFPTVPKTAGRKAAQVRLKGTTNRELTKECDSLKNTILRIVSIVFVLMTILAIACAITGTGSGFLDLSNIARTVCIGVAVVCGILAFIAWKCTMPKD